MYYGWTSIKVLHEERVNELVKLTGGVKQKWSMKPPAPEDSVQISNRNRMKAVVVVVIIVVLSAAVLFIRSNNSGEPVASPATEHTEAADETVSVVCNLGVFCRLMSVPMPTETPAHR